MKTKQLGQFWRSFCQKECPHPPSIQRAHSFTPVSQFSQNGSSKLPKQSALSTWHGDPAAALGSGGRVETAERLTQFGKRTAAAGKRPGLRGLHSPTQTHTHRYTHAHPHTSPSPPPRGSPEKQGHPGQGSAASLCPTGRAQNQTCELMGGPSSGLPTPRNPRAQTKRWQSSQNGS